MEDLKKTEQETVVQAVSDNDEVSCATIVTKIDLPKDAWGITIKIKSKEVGHAESLADLLAEEILKAINEADSNRATVQMKMAFGEIKEKPRAATFEKEYSDDDIHPKGETVSDEA